MRISGESIAFALLLQLWTSCPLFMGIIFHCIQFMRFFLNSWQDFENESLCCSKTLRRFREGEIQVLVSSDAMTRGMDVEGVRSIINYDMPMYIKTYIHRAGRTARAGQTGRCFTLLRKDEVFHIIASYVRLFYHFCYIHGIWTIVSMFYLALCPAWK